MAAYHVEMPLTDALFARGGGLRATRNQAYAVVRPEPATATAPQDTVHHAPAERTVGERRAV
ncbi:hypothetical protein OG332_30915 [Streptomyces sp. NBC_01233]|nr:hypothetical protein OG332_30915 [Streptomyces sp. NBC_01233]